MQNWKISGRKTCIENAIDTLNNLMKDSEMQMPTYTEATISPLPDFVCEVNLSIDSLGISISKKSSTRRKAREACALEALDVIENKKLLEKIKIDE